MNSDSQWFNVLRLVWLSGGVVAVNQPGPDVQVQAGMSGRIIYQTRINSYPSLFEALREKGFPVLGVTFFVAPEELQGIRSPEFHAFSPTKSWLVSDVKQQWRQIAVAAGTHGHMPLMDVASRIASGLRYSQMRLDDLVKAYSVQLRGRLHGDEAKEYQAFKDTNSFEVYKAIHALFWEMAVLRDALAEFVAIFCFSRAKVRSLKGLLASLRNNPVSDPLADKILRATDQSSHGWLATFTNYRNFFTHVAPMEQAANIASAVQDMRYVSSDLSMPQIYYALPPDIEELSRKRAQGIIFNSLEELTLASFRRHERVSEPDALDYLHGCLNDFAELSLILVGRSPIAPKRIELGPEDIIGGVQVSSRGTG
jgi:hypothetical protein